MRVLWICHTHKHLAYESTKKTTSTVVFYVRFKDRKCFFSIALGILHSRCHHRCLIVVIDTVHECLIYCELYTALTI